MVFDLDGTLVDSRPSIISDLQHVLKARGARVPEAREMQRLVGPPLIESLKGLLGTDDPVELQMTLELFQERQREVGLFEHIPFVGASELLATITEAGCWLALATAKHQAMADRIVEHLSWGDFFRSVVGSRQDGSGASKADLITAALAPVEGGVGRRAVMVGDHPNDINGANSVGIDSIAVTYGYGTSDDLEDSRPTHWAESLDDIEKLLIAK